jgi:hypothetical protein
LVSITTEGRSSSLCAVGVANSLDDGERGKNGSWAWARSGRGRDFVFRQLAGKKCDSLLWFCRLKNRCTTSCLSIWEVLTTVDSLIPREGIFCAGRFPGSFFECVVSPDTDLLSVLDSGHKKGRMEL